MKHLQTLLLGMFALSACATTPAGTSNHAAATRASAHSGDHRVFDAERDAAADVEAALGRARESGRRVLLVFGANWCHDSRGFAEHLERPEIAALVEERFEVVFIDVGTPQRGRGRNLDLAARFGQDEVVGTPTVVLLEMDGTRINRTESATAWRNAHSRSPSDVLAELQSYADWIPCSPMPVSVGPGEPYRAPDCEAWPPRP